MIGMQEVTITKNSVVEEFIAPLTTLTLPNNSYVEEQRAYALNKINESSFPNSKTEYWKYHRLNKINKAIYNPAQKATIDISSIELPVRDSYKFYFVNGFLNKDLSDTLNSELFELNTIENAINSNQEDLNKVLFKYNDYSNNIYTSINSAFFNNGFYLKVNTKQKVDKPIDILFVSSGENQITNTRNVIIADKFSEADITLHYHGINTSNNFNNTVNEVLVEDNVLLNIQVIEAEKETSHFHSTYVNQQGNSQFHHNAFCLEGTINRNNTNVLVNGSNCETNTNGLFIPKNKEVFDFHTFIDHAKPNCESNQLFKGVIYDQSRAIFNGRVLVRKDAQKINAFQSNGNILMSKKAIIDTKPELEIYADDVKCSHGTTTGQLDDSAIFYLKTRGLSELQSKELLVNAFIEEVVDEVPNEILKAYLKDMLNILS